MMNYHHWLTKHETIAIQYQFKQTTVLKPVLMKNQPATKSHRLVEHACS